MMTTLTIRDRLESPQFAEQISKVLPKHLTPERMTRVAITAMMKTPKLSKCDQTSFFNAMLTLSQLGLEPDGRNSHLIPFENRKKGIVECQVIVDYKGFVQLIMQTGLVSRIHSDVVCEEDSFDYDRGILKTHKPNFRKDRGKVFAVYCIIEMKDGTEKVEVMSALEVEAIRKRSRSGGDGPWVTDWNEMAKKTVFRRASKWVPISSEKERIAFEVDDQDVIEGRVTKAITQRDDIMQAITAKHEPERVEEHEMPQATLATTETQAAFADYVARLEKATKIGQLRSLATSAEKDEYLDNDLRESILGEVKDRIALIESEGVIK
jgi:recombination protein RecT